MPDAGFKCHRSGRCCLSYNPFSTDHTGRCPQLRFADGQALCLLHGTPEKPQECVEYPVNNVCLRMTTIGCSKTRKTIEELDQELYAIEVLKNPK